MEFQYAFYPTLLDSYFRYKKSEDELSFIQLFDKINKVEQDPDEARLKGMAFEELINQLIKPSEGITPIAIDDIYEHDGFEFSEDLVNKIAYKLKRSTAIQDYQEKIIETPRGKVKLYGVFDYKFPEMTADLKTTNSYSFGKYEENMQHKFISLITNDKQFNYVATDFEYMFIENYWLTNKLRKQAISDIVEFIDFINHFKKFITNTKLFEPC